MQSDYLHYALRQLEALIHIPSPSGFTDRAVGYCAGELERLGFRPERTAKGSLLVCLGGADDALVLSAHLDTLGAMVREIKENGALRAAPIGGLQANSVETETARVFTRGGRIVEGTFQLENASAHVNDGFAKTRRTFDTLELLLDEKTRSAKETRALGVEAGDMIAVDPRFVVTQTGFIKSRFLDDKLSAAILLTLAKFLRDKTRRPKRKLYLLFTVYEEVGHGAAAIPADTAEFISVDMGCVGEGLACTETMTSICVMDSAGPSDRSVVDGLVEAAKSAGVRCALDVYPRYTSDADAAVRAGHEVRHGAVGAGVYASHGYERAHVEGLAGTFDLLNMYIGTADVP